MSISSIKYRGETRPLDDAARQNAPGKFAALSDGIVHYQLAGPVNAQTVVLVHGFSIPYYLWDPTFPALVSAGFRVLRYDLYGRGYSDRPQVPYDQDLFDRQLGELLEALEIHKPVDLVGLSLGGAIAVVFTHRHPQAVRRLCLIDPVGLTWEKPLTAKLVQVPFIGERIMSLLGDRVLLGNLPNYFYNPSDLEAFTRQFKQQMQYFGFKAALLSTLRCGVDTGAGASYAAVGASGLPVMLVWGRQDREVPFEISAQVKALIPQLEFHPIDRAAHIPHYEHPDTVNPLLVEFLSRQV